MTRSLQKIGILLVVVSIVTGLIGTALCIYLSFTALDVSENAGIGAVGNWILYALFFSAGGILGTLIGLVLFILGRSRK